jgi:hypothetical protein
MCLHEFLLSKTNLFHGFSQEICADLFLLLDHIVHKVPVLIHLSSFKKYTTLLEEFLLFLGKAQASILHYYREYILVVAECKEAVSFAFCCA